MFVVVLDYGWTCHVTVTNDQFASAEVLFCPASCFISRIPPFPFPLVVSPRLRSLTMGKDQYKKKTQAERRRHNPIRVPDSHIPHGTLHLKGKEKEEAMLPILKKVSIAGMTIPLMLIPPLQLSDPDENERAWACAAVTNLIQNDPATRRLFQGKNVVGALVERMTDGSDGVVAEAVGALRNLAIDGGYEVVGEMFNKGIMVGLAGLVGKVSRGEAVPSEARRKHERSEKTVSRAKRESLSRAQRDQSTSEARITLTSAARISLPSEARTLSRDSEHSLRGWGNP